MAYKPALWALNCMKGVLREFLPPHIRFVRSGSHFGFAVWGATSWRPWPKKA